MLHVNSFPIAQMSGTMYLGQDRNFYVMNGKQVSRSLAIQPPRNSNQQISSRLSFKECAQGWKTLNREQVEAWLDYASGLCKVTSYGVLRRMALNVFMEANYFRVLFGESLALTPGVEPPKCPVTELTAVTVPVPIDILWISFKVHNPESKTFYVLIRQSPPYSSPGRRPRDWEFRSRNVDTSSYPVFEIPGSSSLNCTWSYPYYRWYPGNYGHLLFTILSTDFWPGDRYKLEVLVS